MALPLPAETFATLRTALARMVGALRATGTVTGATASTLDDTRLVFASTDALKGMQVVVKTGTGAVSGNDRLASAFTPASDRIVVVPNWGTTPAVDDTYDVYDPRVADLGLLNLAIKYAIERVQDWHRAPWEDVASLVLGNVLANGGFEDWTAGTSSAPDGWTASGTSHAVAREGTLIYVPFRYGCKLTNGASNAAYIQQQNASLGYPWDLLGGKIISVSALSYCTTASRVRLQLTDGATTWNSSYHGGTGWEKLTIDSKTLAAALTELTVQGRIETGTSISAYFHDFRTIPQANIYDYYLPKRFSHIAQLERETGTDFKWDTIIPRRVFGADLNRERLVFNASMWSPPGAFRVRIIGERYQAVPSSDSDEIILPLSVLLPIAASFIVQKNQPGTAAAAQVQILAQIAERSLPRARAGPGRRVR